LKFRDQLHREYLETGQLSKEGGHFVESSEPADGGHSVQVKELADAFQGEREHNHARI
jgi:hypothetical protein